MTHGTLQRLSDRRPLIERGGNPSFDFQRAWQEIVEHLERAEEDIAGKQGADATLDALALLDGTPGILVQTDTDEFTKRTLSAPAAGLTINHPAGTAGNPTFALANDLLGLEGLSSTGLARRTGTDTWSLLPYEESTFTPNLLFGGASTGITYSSRAGVQTRVGRLVFIEVSMVLTNKGSATGNATISGLTHTVAAAPGGLSLVLGANLNTVAVPSVGATTGATTMTLFDFTASSFVQMNETDFNNNSQLYFSLTYRV